MEATGSWKWRFETPSTVITLISVRPNRLSLHQQLNSQIPTLEAIQSEIASAHAAWRGC